VPPAGPRRQPTVKRPRRPGVTTATGADVIPAIRINGVHVASAIWVDGQAAKAELDHPYGAAVDGPGNLVIADTVNNRIRMVTG
jgi:hypothetical protein